MESQTSQPAPQAPGVAPQAATNYQQSQPQQVPYSQPVPQYYPQASQYPAPMAQPQAPQQQAWQSPQSTAIARLEALLSQPTAPAQYPTSPAPYQYQAAPPAPTLHQTFPGYLPSGLSPSQYPASPQTSTSIPQSYSQSGVTPADLSIVSGITSQAALATLAQIPSAEIDVSKSTLNALAVDYEEKIFDLSEMVEQMAPAVQQAYDLKALWTPEGFPHLSELFLDTLATVPGAYDYFLENGFTQLSRAFVAPAVEHNAQKQQAQQQAQQQAYQPQQTGTYWPDGDAPLDRDGLRPGFPGIPNPSGQQSVPQIDLEGLTPNQAFATIDAISNQGGFRGTTFASE